MTMTSPPAEAPKPSEPILTQRQLQILHGMSYGRKNGDIANRLHLTEDTVKTHARRIFRKLGAVDRAHAVRIGLERGLLAPSSPTRPVAHPRAVPGQPIPTAGLTQLTLRDPTYRDQHIAACSAAEACPCRTNSTWAYPTATKESA